MALRKCPGLLLLRPDFRLYEKNSRAFMQICRRYAPVVEKFSIDECFLDMTGTGSIYPDPTAVAGAIKDAIREELGFTVNVGIGPNKILAKMASDFEKPDKVHTLFTADIEEKLWPLPVRELFSVGGATAEKLEKAHIRTIGDLANAELRRVQLLLGKKPGQQIWDYANGRTTRRCWRSPKRRRAIASRQHWRRMSPRCRKPTTFYCCWRMASPGACGPTRQGAAA